MSIIQEALRKSQNTYLKNKEPQKKEPQKSVILPQKTAAPKSSFRIKIRAAQRVKLLIAAILIVISGMMIISAFFLLSFFSKGKFLAKGKNIAPVILPKEKSPVAAAEKKLPEPVKKPETGRALPMPPAPAQPALMLNGIMYLDDKPQAIINGYILEEGDAINGATVVLIDKDYVLLNSSDSKVRLRLNK